ncbi:hypothetical protein L3556_12875 [Candidatus Synechococcus calcipolaris G9]|uniref:Antibiotic biosynthesis monooxygenase n=1 Tax=Candidatus Synechococcus calcipolaris G9 TaxID=1497997 RepID=A0ABT6F1V7_9SYNE|nr:hypothetical protein [Candidatus Synechococcus calcipolaris]MDG2991817.1 hypothetical protein [Candidatus Synechococcus calcipolaris G9]
MTVSLGFIISASVDQKSEFAVWQADLIRSATGEPGFVSVEVLPKYPSKSPNTALIFTFDTEAQLIAWQHQNKTQTLFAERSIQKVQPTSLGKDYQVHGSVTDVITNIIQPDREGEYLDWIRRIQMMQSQFPGHCGVYFQSPLHSQKPEWITLLRFETLQDLEVWYGSPIREELQQEAENFILSIQRQRVQGAFAGWFPSASTPPPVWKQTLLVLLVLFPIVMLQQRFLSPVLKTWGLNSSLSIFIGNAMSVHLVAWPMMPLAQSFMQWWLSPPPGSQRRLINAVGLGTLTCFYTILVAVFWNLL